MSTVRPAGMLANNGRNLVDWFTGTGFLTLNALCFFGALVTLIPWNIYSNPGDFWSADILIRWAFLLGFHALLVATWSLIRNVILRDDNPVAEMTPSARQWHAARARTTASAINFRSASTSSAAAATASTLYAEEWSRQRQDESVQAVDRDEATNNEYVEPRPQSTDISDLLADWDTSWPEPAATVAASSEQETERPIEKEQLQEEDSLLIEDPAPQRTPGPLTAAARVSSSTDSAVDPELEWQWIEAAATAWLSRREVDTSSSSRSGSAGN